MVTEVVLPTIGKCLGEPNLVIRRSAAAALGRLGPVAGPLVDVLERQLYSDDEELCEVAIAALGAIGKPGLPALLQFSAPRGSLTRAGAQAIVSLEAQGIDALARTYHLRSLFFFFQPMVKMELLVPAAAEARAYEVVKPELLETV